MMLKTVSALLLVAAFGWAEDVEPSEGGMLIYLYTFTFFYSLTTSNLTHDEYINSCQDSHAFGFRKVLKKKVYNICLLRMSS